MRKVLLSLIGLCLLVSAPAMAAKPTAAERQAICKEQCSSDAKPALCVKKCLAKMDKENGKAQTAKKTKKAKKATEQAQ
jgi:hypothetical protein